MSEFLRRVRALPLLLLLAACAAFPPAAQQPPPVVFVHGNGDTAAVLGVPLADFQVEWFAFVRDRYRL